MNINKNLEQRSGNQCELCSAKENLHVFLVTGAEGVNPEDSSIYICSTCQTQIEDPETIDANHWRCLNDSMWSEVDAVKVQAWRMLTTLKAEGWPQDLLDMMYLEDDVLHWAKADGHGENPADKVIHKDSNGVTLAAGDSVVLIKDLNVKGGGFTAKRGTAVRRISLVHDNPEHIEGRVEGQHIVILTQYVKKI
ncbi:MAG: PhnA domain-containing protein [Putridiphycobacter sp.]|nr:PhnA domain-containing protein [Putridiphycobacter sp.]